MKPSPTLLIVAAFAGGAMFSAYAASADAPAAIQSAPPGKSCFFRSQVDGFQHVRGKRRGDDAVIVSAGPGRKYLFETLGPCPDLDWTETIGFDETGAGQICDGLDVTLVVPSSIGPQRCAVKMIRPISTEEAKAY